MTGCSEDGALLQDTNNGEPVAAAVAFAVNNHNNTASSRMSSAVVQEEGQLYRGIEMRGIIPFAVKGKITSTDMPKVFEVVGNGEKPVNSRAYYYYDKCSLMPGIASFLSYGRAPQITPENKAANGSIVETFADLAPKNIRFSLESISQKVANSVANSLANYMTQIATAEGNSIAWKDAPSETLKLIFLNFTNQVEMSLGGSVLPGSSANIKAYTQALKTTLNSLSLTGDDEAIRDAIIAKIEAYDNDWNGFPASIGLPDGAAAVRWDGTKFVAEVSNTSLADINGIDRFAYPAELYYYGNSRIKTSNIDNRKTSYINQDWSNVLATYEYDNGVVSQNTTAIAIIEPLQYAVAGLQIKLKQTESNLTDAKGTAVEVGTNNFPLTGIIVGGQMPVGFDFKPTTSYPVYSEADMKYIYDNQLPALYLSSETDATLLTNTLVLQTYDNKKVPVALEFINNSDKDFVGVDGIVYKGTKFYLVAEIDPSEFSEDPRTEIRDRVFTQDYTTTLNMKVTGLAKAYNVVPNLLSPRLELGIELVTKWVSTTPEEVIF